MKTIKSNICRLPWVLPASLWLLGAPLWLAVPAFGRAPDEVSDEEVLMEAGGSQQDPESVEGADQSGRHNIVYHPVVLDVLDLKEMDILDVLKLISQKSGLNIVAGQNVKGRVTVFLKNVDVREALRIIVEAHDWAYVQDGGIFKIMTGKDYEVRYGRPFGQDIRTRIKQVSFAKAANLAAVLNQIKSSSGKVISDDTSGTLILVDDPLKLDAMEEIIKQLDVSIETKVFDLSYAEVDEISGKITEALTPAIGTMKSDKRSGSIVVSDTERVIKRVERMIEAFDKKDKEVLIEAKILQVVLNNEHKMGVDWQAVAASMHSMTLTGDLDVLGGTEKSGKLSIGTISSDDYTFLIEALDTIGTTNILSNPSITAVNNKEARILVGSTEPYVTTTTTAPASGPTTIAESVNFVEVGVKLFVTPTIHNDGFITMKIKPEVSAVTSNLTTSNNNTIPIIATSEAETTVIIKDGVTIIIGGLIKDEVIKTTKKIPLLGDIPVLRHAFRSISDASEKTEIVIFLTPKIITGDVARKDREARL